MIELLGLPSILSDVRTKLTLLCNPYRNRSLCSARNIYRFSRFLLTVFGPADRKLPVVKPCIHSVNVVNQMIAFSITIVALVSSYQRDKAIPLINTTRNLLVCCKLSIVLPMLLNMRFQQGDMTSVFQCCLSNKTSFVNCFTHTVEHKYDACHKYSELGSFRIIAYLYVSDGSRR